MPGNVVATLRARQLVRAVTSEAITQRVETATAAYCGVDPTASSLHVGNMATLMALLHFHLGGHQAVALVGSATGTIGDPSGRSTERTVLARQELTRNVDAIDAQLRRFFERGTAYAQRHMEINDAALQPVVVARNADWYENMGVLDFLGRVGRHARVGAMMARDSVRSRLQSPQGLSFNEFSYQLLQAYDFWHLHREHACSVQIGGSDQWGNITAGADLIRRMDPDASVYGLTVPLLTTTSGEKFGKSAGNAVWLDETRTSPFAVYQFFVRTADADVERLLKVFTLLPLDRIETVMQEHRAAPEGFGAQALLAAEATELIHGAAGLQQALCATEVLFGGANLNRFSAAEVASAFAGDSRMVTVSRTAAAGKAVDELAVLAGAVRSKSEAARLVQGGGLYWNGHVVTDRKWVPDATTGDYVGEGTVGVVRTGKANHRLIQLVD
ncbi:tyrosyl-tRNA synthetase [Coemansia sp. RSA 552]|nr:tyrosyl-tRNA synthetase [Coemansia sp. RSA 552]